MATCPIVLLSCGSFNPPHLMHLRMFESAKDLLEQGGKYRVLRGLLSPVHDGYGKNDLVPAKHRIAMCQAAVASSDWLEVTDWEANQAHYQRTLSVLDHVSQSFAQPGEDAVQVKLLMGADMLASFGVPGVWKDEDIVSILTRHGIVCVSRPGHNASEIVKQVECLRAHENKIEVVQEWVTNDVSSTGLRNALRNGQSVRYLMPDAVQAYIAANHLYAPSTA